MTQYPEDPQPYAGQPGPQPVSATGEDRTWAILAHLAGPIAMVISAGWLGFVGPLVIWFLGKGRSPFVRNAAAGAFNFNLGLTVMTIVGWICFFTVLLIPLALLLWLVAFVLLVVCHVTGAIRANRGEPYRYPLQIPILT